jgi:hypothetical protein
MGCRRDDHGTSAHRASRPTAPSPTSYARLSITPCWLRRATTLSHGNSRLSRKRSSSGRIAGAALAFVRIAIGQLGHDAVTEVLPKSNERDLLARVRLGASLEADEAERALFDAIPRRRTMREPFTDRDPAPALVQELERLAEREGAWLAGVNLDGRQEVAALVNEGGRVQLTQVRSAKKRAEHQVSNDPAHVLSFELESCDLATAPA